MRGMARVVLLDTTCPTTRRSRAEQHRDWPVVESSGKLNVHVKPACDSNRLANHVNSYEKSAVISNS